MENILIFLDRIAPIITIVAFVLLWHQIRSIKKIAPKEEEWARNVQTMSKQFAELEENISKGKFGESQSVKEIGTVIGGLNKSVESLWLTMKKSLKLNEK